MYPASFMPLDTMASAISRTLLSSTRDANLFQEFQPMGGVLAKPLGFNAVTGGRGLWVGMNSAGIFMSAAIFFSTGGVKLPRPPGPPGPRPAAAPAAPGGAPAGGPPPGGGPPGPPGPPRPPR